jgi:acyl transferase domain-containing protein
MQAPVLRTAGLDSLLEQHDTLFIEVGPGDRLATQAINHHLGKHSRLILPTLTQQGRTADDLSRQWLDCLGKIWCAGFDIDWRINWSSARRARIALPAYPFEKIRHWIDR